MHVRCPTESMARRELTKNIGNDEMDSIWLIDVHPLPAPVVYIVRALMDAQFVAR